jgi:hypothetical protein
LISFETEPFTGKVTPMFSAITVGWGRAGLDGSDQ